MALSLSQNWRAEVVRGVMENFEIQVRILGSGDGKEHGDRRVNRHILSTTGQAHGETIL
jgi:hypothetical protein